MRYCFSAVFTAVSILILAVATVATAQAQKCDPKAKGKYLQERQSAAIKDFAHIFLVEKNVKKAFDAYVPGEYIQHNPDALSGREPAIKFLTELWGSSGIYFTNITAWAGEGIGMMHYRMKLDEVPIHFALMDRLRFEGTCFVEHWDVIQAITGKEINPIAFF